VDYRIRRDSDPRRILVTHIDNLKPYEGPLSLDINLQTLTPDEIPLLVHTGLQQFPHTVNDQFARIIDIPTEPLPVVQDSSDSDDVEIPPLRAREKRATHPPARYGWD